MDTQLKAHLRDQLCDLQLAILKAIIHARSERSSDDLASISEETAADVIYAIDKVAEDAIRQWFDSNWSAEHPVEIVMEGVEDGYALTYPENTPIADPPLKCIIDPIDGTRGIMYDKRPAWIISAIAPQRGQDNCLRDIEVAAMTEIPTTRQWRADQLSATRGGGVRSVAIDVRSNFSTTDIELQPSQAIDVRHAFGTISRFFPAGSTLLAQVEEELWDKLYADDSNGTPLVFNDQYISTGGQFYEILAGHDRFIADIRPLVFRVLDIEENLSAHPYDVAAALILEEAGCIIEHPDGSPLNCPLDTTSAVNWVAYANQGLADHIRPVLQALLARLS
ncbi:MAG: inositol monophosphatase [Coraliomargarita sp.]